MRAHVRTAATVSIAVGVLAGCSSTTTGTLARTTEPGPPLTTSRAPTSSRPTELPPLPTDLFPPPRKPTVPAPANSSTMTCKEYAGLDEETQLAVVYAIVAEEPNRHYEVNVVPMLKSLADALCGIVPSAVVRDVVGPR